MRLIDIDALIERHCEGCHEEIRKSCQTDPVCATLMWFEEAPIVDAVPVVRCKDCRHCSYDEIFGQHWCGGALSVRKVKPDDYCSYGERKDGDGNG